MTFTFYYMILPVFVISAIANTAAAIMPREFLPSPLRGHGTSKTKLIDMRRLDGTQCLAEVDVLHEANPALEAALAHYSDEVETAENACGDAPSCTIDEDTFPSTPLYMNACTGAGGEIWESDWILQCTASLDGETETATYIFLNEDSCFPKDSSACSTADVQSAIESAINAEIDFLETFISAATDATLVCDFGITITDPSGATSRSGNLPIPDPSALSDNSAAATASRTTMISFYMAGTALFAASMFT